MMSPIIFSLFGHTTLTEEIAKYHSYEIGDIILRQFPDEETYLKINTNVKGRIIIIIASLERPNYKCLPLIFVAQTLMDLGAKEIQLIAPYLPYMRQDSEFHPGEGITSKYFASVLSTYFNNLVTVDPHLHRYRSLAEIYTIPTTVLHAAEPIAQWIKAHVESPLIIGPDKESEQWIADIAQKIDAPFIVLEKIRRGDNLVKISLPSVEKYKKHTPILVDDIISTARTMIEAIQHLKYENMTTPICIGVHAVFSGNAYDELLEAGVSKVITTNTIEHPSNVIDLSAVIAFEN